jgi:mono/diheme cytochrome c family protein
VPFVAKKGALAVVLLALLVPLTAEATPLDDALKRGEAVFNMGGCASCHTNKKAKGKPLAGGLPLKTPFGVFFSPNITPDPETGIGGWSEVQFVVAMTRGVSPKGGHYFPAFPFTSYAKMSQRDLSDLKVFLDQTPPVKNAVRDHDLAFPFNQRLLAWAWKFLFFDSTPFQPRADKDEAWNRGAYIVNGPGHCVECHTPRNIFGALDRSKLLQGTNKGPDGEKVPGIVADGKNGFSKWKITDIVFSLQSGMKPDGDFLGGSMGKVVANTTGKMPEADLKAIATYLMNPE